MRSRTSPVWNPRIQSLSAASSLGFIGVHAAAQTARAYPGETGWKAVDCNPNCKPGKLRLTCGPAVRYDVSWTDAVVLVVLRK
jgi:hypothetical protein